MHKHEGLNLPSRITTYVTQTETPAQHLTIFKKTQNPHQPEQPQGHLQKKERKRRDIKTYQKEIGQQE